MQGPGTRKGPLLQVTSSEGPRGCAPTVARRPVHTPGSQPRSHQPKWASNPCPLQDGRVHLVQGTPRRSRAQPSEGILHLLRGRALLDTGRPRERSPAGFRCCGPLERPGPPTEAGGSGLEAEQFHGAELGPGEVRKLWRRPPSRGQVPSTLGLGLNEVRMGSLGLWT